MGGGTWKLLGWFVIVFLTWKTGDVAWLCSHGRPIGGNVAENPGILGLNQSCTPNPARLVIAPKITRSKGAEIGSCTYYVDELRLLGRK